MVYRIEFSPTADRQFRKLPLSVETHLKPHIDALTQTPRPRGVEEIPESEDFFRIRVGNYRVNYQVVDDVLLVLVLRVGHRKDIYRRGVK